MEEAKLKLCRSVGKYGVGETYRKIQRGERERVEGKPHTNWFFCVGLQKDPAFVSWINTSLAGLNFLNMHCGRNSVHDKLAEVKGTSRQVTVDLNVVIKHISVDELFNSFLHSGLSVPTNLRKATLGRG